MLPDDATAPMPGEMLTLVAFVTDHDNVPGFPATTEGGVAMKELMTGTGTWTMTVVSAVVEPPALVAVSV